MQSNATTLTYALDSPLIPYTQEVVTIPGGAHGLTSKSGATLSSSHTVAFGVAAGDTLRLQQLLAAARLPAGRLLPDRRRPRPRPTWPSTSRAPSRGAGPACPTQLTSQWTQGTMNQITKAAIEDFENQNSIGVDGEAGPTVWTALLNDVINNKVSATPYVYVLVNKVVPQTATLWNNGTVQYTVPVNSGAPGADTTDGTYAVFEHVRFSDMKGTNVDGSTYDDPNVPYASYFNGGDALHGFVRASYGTPQSNGCVEMSYANAALIWALDPDRDAGDRGRAGLRHGATPDHHDDHRTGGDDDDRSRGAGGPDRRCTTTTLAHGGAGALTRGRAPGRVRARSSARPTLRQPFLAWAARAWWRSTSWPWCVAAHGAGARGRGPGGAPPRRRPRGRCGRAARSTPAPWGRHPPARTGRPAGTTGGRAAPTGCAGPWSPPRSTAWRWRR